LVCVVIQGQPEELHLSSPKLQVYQLD